MKADARNPGVQAHAGIVSQVVKAGSLSGWPKQSR